MKASHSIAPLIAAAALALAAGCGEKEEPEVPIDTGFEGVDLANCTEVEYEGEGEPDALIVSDLPMQGDSAERSAQQVEAIRLILEQHGWGAGETTIGFQACDDSIEETGLWDVETCRANAEAYGADERVLGVIGTYNSGCAAEEIPILNRSPVAMISPGNTAVCLTEQSTICTDKQPESLYPSGERNYVRVVPNDAFQGAALAEFAVKQGIKNPFVLYAADDETSTGQAENFRGGAAALKLDLAGFDTWEPKDREYRALFAKVKRSGADAVVLAGLTEQNVDRLINDKVDVLGPNSKVPLLAFDGIAQQSTIDGAGAASRGMFASVPGRVPTDVPAAGAAFVQELEAALGGAPVEQFAPYAGEAALVLLDAIAEAGTDREAIVQSIFATPVEEGLVGDYEFEATGDPSVGPITVLEAGTTFKPLEVVTPDPKTVSAARG